LQDKFKFKQDKYRLNKAAMPNKFLNFCEKWENFSSSTSNQIQSAANTENM